MTNNIPIPAYEHLSLPGPAWLLVTLSTFTFWIHLLLAGSLVGSLIFLFVRRFRLRSESLLDRQLDTRIIKTLPVLISLTITFGIGPLLFTQVLYGHYFYSANIFIGNFWIMSLGFLFLGFICVYLTARYWNHSYKTLLLLLVLGCFLAIIYIFTNNALLSVLPEHWINFHRQIHLLRVPDSTLFPRLLHNIGATFVISGLAIAWIGRFRPASSDIPPAQCAEHATSIGLQWMLFGFVLQVAFGLWWLFSLPPEMRTNLISLSNFTSTAWWLAILLAALNLLTIIKGIIRPQKIWLLLSTFLPLLGMFGMLMARQQLRTAYLARDVAGSFDINNWNTQVQRSPLIALAVILLLGLIAIIVMLVLILRRGPSAAPSPVPVHQPAPTLSAQQQNDNSLSQDEN